MVDLFGKVTKDSLLNKLLKNAGTLLSGNVIASILGLLTLAIAARALGPQAFGILVIIQTYILIIDGVMNFQSWQAMVKFGTDLREDKKNKKFKALIKYILLIDIITAIFATTLAITLVNFIGPLLNIGEENYTQVFIFSLVILFHISGVPIALLRIFDKFKLFATQTVLTAFIKLICVFTLSLFDVGLIGFIIIWTVTDIFGHVLLIYFGFRELKKHGYYEAMKEKISLLKGSFKNIWIFVLTTNLNSSIRMTTRQLDVLIVSNILGNNAVGLYKIAKQFSLILSKLSDPLYQAIYPQLAKLYKENKILNFKSLMVKASLLISIPVSIIWLIFFLFGGLIINLTVGEAFSDSEDVMIWYMLAIAVSVVSFPLQPAMLAQGYPQFSFWVHLVSTAIYFLIIFPLINNFNLAGAGISYFIYYVVWSTIMFVIVNHTIKKVKN